MMQKVDYLNITIKELKSNPYGSLCKPDKSQVKKVDGSGQIRIRGMFK